MKNLTPFGKEVRKHRIDKGMRLMELAKNIGVSSAFLSSVETGKKTISPKLIGDIVKCLDLDEQQAKKLEKLAEGSRKSLLLNIQDARPVHRDLATMFTRRFEELSVSDVNKIMNILRKDST